MKKKKLIILSLLAITAAMLTACSDKNDAAVRKFHRQKKVQKIRIQIHLQKQRRNPQRMSKKIRRLRVQTM